MVMPSLPPDTLRRLCLTVEDSLLRHCIRCTNVTCTVVACTHAKSVIAVNASAKAYAQRLLDERLQTAAATAAAKAAPPPAPVKRAFFSGSESMEQTELGSWLFYAMHAKQCMANQSRNPAAGCPVLPATSMEKCKEKQALWRHAMLCPEYCKATDRPLPPAAASSTAPVCIDAQCVRLRKWWPELKLAVAEGAILLIDAGRAVMMRAYRLRHGNTEVPLNVPAADRDAYVLLEPYPELCTSLLRAQPPLRARVLDIIAARGKGGQEFLDRLRAERMGGVVAAVGGASGPGADSSEAASRLPLYARLPGFMVQTPPTPATRTVPVDVADAVRGAVRQQLDDATAATAAATSRRTQYAPAYAHINVLAAAGVDTAVLHPAIQLMAPADMLRNAKPQIGAAPCKSSLEVVLHELRRAQEAHIAASTALEAAAAGIVAPSVVGDEMLRELKLSNIIMRMVAFSLPPGARYTASTELPELPPDDAMDAERQTLAARFNESMETYKAFFAKLAPSWRRASVFSSSGMGLAYRMRLAVHDSRVFLHAADLLHGPPSDAALALETLPQADVWLRAVGARITLPSDVFNEADPQFQTVAHNEEATLRHVTPLDRRDVALSLLPHFASDGNLYTASPVALMRDATASLGCSILAGVAAFARVRQQRLLRSLLALRAEAEHGAFTRSQPPPASAAGDAGKDVPHPPMPVALFEYGSDTNVQAMWPATCTKWHAWYLKTFERARNRALDIARRRVQRQPEDATWFNLNLESRDVSIAAPDKAIPLAQPLGVRDAADQHRTHIEQLCHKACSAYYMPAAHAMESQLRSGDGMPTLTRPQTDGVDVIAMAATERLFASSLADAVQVVELGHVVINVARVDDAITQCMKSRPTVTLQDVTDYFAAMEAGQLDAAEWYADVATPLPSQLEAALREAAGAQPEAATSSAAASAAPAPAAADSGAHMAVAGTKRRRDDEVAEESATNGSAATKHRAVGTSTPTRDDGAPQPDLASIATAQQRAVARAGSIRSLGNSADVTALAAWAQARGRIIAVADSDAGMAATDETHVDIPETALEPTLSRSASAARLADAMAIV